MKFWKMNGAGNDFIIINNIEEHIPIDKLGKLAKTLCTRRMSIGADGLMVVDKADGDADYKMRFYNADGSMGEMCGNGARCICRYGYENGLAGEIQTIETTAGIVKGERISERMYKVRLNDPGIVLLHCLAESWRSLRDPPHVLCSVCRFFDLLWYVDIVNSIEKNPKTF